MTSSPWENIPISLIFSRLVCADETLSLSNPELPYSNCGLIDIKNVVQMGGNQYTEMGQNPIDRNFLEEKLTKTSCIVSNTRFPLSVIISPGADKTSEGSIAPPPIFDDLFFFMTTLSR